MELKRELEITLSNFTDVVDQVNDVDWLISTYADRIMQMFIRQCNHEWVDVRNEVVESGEMCIRCNSVRAGNISKGK
jgi:hypothetical protein